MWMCVSFIRASSIFSSSFSSAITSSSSISLNRPSAKHRSQARRSSVNTSRTLSAFRGGKNSGWKSGLPRRMERDDSSVYDSQATVGLYPGDDAREYVRIPRHAYPYIYDGAIIGRRRGMCLPETTTTTADTQIDEYEKQSG